MWRDDATRRRAIRCRSWLLTAAPPRWLSSKWSALKAKTVRAPEHRNANPGKVLPLGSRAGWSLPQAQHVLQYAAAGVIPIDKDKYILLLIFLSDIQHGMQKNQFKSSLTLEMKLDQLPDKRYCSGLRVSTDRDANRAAHTLAKAAVLDLQRPGLCETLTLRWRGVDSNFRFRAKTSFVSRPRRAPRSRGSSASAT